LPSGFGFRLHGRGWGRLFIVMRRHKLRSFEADLRAARVVIVDQWGARIDFSQFAKEEDPEFNRDVDDGLPPLLVTLLTPNAVLRWRLRRLMRQSSDDATRE
jgi:hypothetical protein